MEKLEGNCLQTRNLSSQSLAGSSLRRRERGDQPHSEHLRGLASECLSWKLFRECFWTPRVLGCSHLYSRLVVSCVLMLRSSLLEDPVSGWPGTTVSDCIPVGTENACLDWMMGPDTPEFIFFFR